MPRQDSPTTKIRDIDPSADPWGYLDFPADAWVPDGTGGTTIEAYGTDQTQQLYAYRCEGSQGTKEFFVNWFMPMDYAPGGRVEGYVRYVALSTYAGGAGITGSTMIAIAGTIRATHPLYDMPTATDTNSLSTTVDAAGASVGTNVWLADNYAYSMIDVPAEVKVKLQPTAAGALYPNDGTAGQTLPGDLFQWKINEEGTLRKSNPGTVMLLGASVRYEKGMSIDT